MQCELDVRSNVPIKLVVIRSDGEAQDELQAD